MLSDILKEKELAKAMLDFYEVSEKNQSRKAKKIMNWIKWLNEQPAIKLK